MSKVEAYIRRLAKELLSKPVRSGIFNTVQPQHLPTIPAVYLLWSNQHIQCIGQCSDVNAIGSILHTIAKTNTIHQQRYYTNIPSHQLQSWGFSYLPMRIGRQELKEHLVTIHRPPYFFMVLPQQKIAHDFQVYKSKYTNAYQKWTEDEERRLVNEITKGTPITAIANQLNRNRGAVYARLRKLGLYPYLPSKPNTKGGTRYPTSSE